MENGNARTMSPEPASIIHVWKIHTYTATQDGKYVSYSTLQNLKLSCNCDSNIALSLTRPHNG